MTLQDELTQAEYLEQLAREVKSLSARVGSFERERMEALLGDGSAVRVGSPGIPNMSVGASDLNRTLGNVQPFYGQTNLLFDPTFEQFETVLPIETTENAFGLWLAKYVLNSGTAPTTRSFATLHDRGGSDYNPFNSAVVRLNLATFASGTTTYYLYPFVGFAVDADVPDLPYFVASCRIGDFGNTLNVLTNITSITVTLQIIDSADNVEAESDALDFKALVGRRPEIQQLVAAFQNTVEDTYRWRLKVVVVASGSGGNVRVNIAEPMFHYAYSPDPAPFSPQLARWQAPFVFASRINGTGDAAPVLETTYNGSDDILFMIRGDGRIEWYDGAGGAADAFLKRSAAGGLQVGDDVAGGIIDRYDGADVFNDWTPALANHGGVTYTVQDGWWQRIGKMVFVNAHIVINAAGAGASTVTMTLPFTPDRDNHQVLLFGGGSVFTAGMASSGVALVSNGGSGAVVDQFRVAGDAATNRDNLITGADLLAGAFLVVQGWFRAA